MTLIRYEPWSVLNQLHGQINRLFDSELDRDAATSAATADWIPKADIEEYADRFVLKLDVPGVDVAAIEITLDKGLLSLSGERVKDVSGRDSSGKDVQRSRVERPHGRFHRRFTLPDTVDAAGVHATGRNGIVEVTIPKQPKAQPRRIQVATA